MPAGVSSGVGRNGPWLQNRWLRIESRLDDGTFSPVALDGAFRPAERLHAFVDLSDGRSATLRSARYDIEDHHDALGHGLRIVLRARDAANGLALRRDAVLYDDRPQAFLRLSATNEGPAPVSLAALNVCATPAAGRGRLRLGAEPRDWRIYRNGWQSWSPTMALAATGPDVLSMPPELAPEPPLEEPGRIASDDVGVLYDPASRRSVLAGAVSARDMLTQVRVDAPARSIAVRCLADGVALAPGAMVSSERIAIDLCDAPQQQLERYGDALGREMGARLPASAPSGWCSWYYFFTQVTEEDVVRNLRVLEQHRREFPIDTVQIDDGYQADIGDWLTVNDKFPHGMEWLASEIKNAGYTPGIWLAPFLIAESSRTYAEHPDWIVRDDAGTPCVASRNWQRTSYGIDGSHPDAQRWLESLFKQVCDGWGYDYVKIDFLYAAAVAGRRHDPSATRLRAYRDALAAVRRGVGDRRFILGCGSLMAPSVGMFDGNRVGLDVAPFWRYLTTEERARPKPRERRPDDALSAESAIRNSLNRWWMHGRLWANDPDCVLVREDRTKLSFDEVRTLATAIAMTGGMVLSSDDLTRVSPERLSILSAMLPPLPSAGPHDLMASDMPERWDVASDRAFDPVRVVALFNFADEARDLRLELPPGDWTAFEFWSERAIGLVRGAVDFSLVEPHACRLVALRPALDTPHVLGTNAHVGMGWHDITACSFSRETLRIEVAPAGRTHRRIWIWAPGREATGATWGGADVRLEQEKNALVASVDADSAGVLEVRFQTR